MSLHESLAPGPAVVGSAGVYHRGFSNGWESLLLSYKLSSDKRAFLTARRIGWLHGFVSFPQESDLFLIVHGI